MTMSAEPNSLIIFYSENKFALWALPITSQPYKIQLMNN
jgi:hypothetical protein